MEDVVGTKDQHSRNEEQLEFLIVSPTLTLEAMRDTGYKDTDHALAELIDNSVEAGADSIHVVAVEDPPDPKQKYARARISEIGVVDNGEGMDQTILRRALKFGDGTRRDREKRGIGRFGVGLPQASISQCQRVDIWTWQNGVDNAYHCYLDLEELRASGRQDVPTPTHDPVPTRWRNISANIYDDTGTLVVWSKLDRVQWSGGGTTLRHTADLCGRVYRKFLADDHAGVSIELVLARNIGGEMQERNRQVCKPNDPLYLMAPSSTPAPFASIPMFRLFNERTWTCSVDGIQGRIHVRCSLAKRDAISEERSTIPWPKSYANPGNSPWGKHALKNTGVSIVRARRELEVSLAWVNNYEPTERWWSVEVEFDPILDEAFGVVNNKQHAHGFVQGAGFVWQEACEPGETYGEFTERLAETGDPRHYLVDVWQWIDAQITQMRKERKKLAQGSRSGSRHPDTGEQVEDAATKVINTQKEEGDVGESDRAATPTREEKIQKIVESAEQVKVEPSTAKEWGEEIVDSGRRVLLKAVTLGHRDAFFAVESVSDVIEVWMNDRHPVHQHLIEVVDDTVEGVSPEDLADRLRKAAFTLKMLLIAWARVEDKAPRSNRETLEDVRMDWGRETRKFLSVIDS